MTTIDTERSPRGRRAFAEVMTFAAPEDATPVNATLLDFVFAEVWERPGLSRRNRRDHKGPNLMMLVRRSRN